MTMSDKCQPFGQLVAECDWFFLTQSRSDETEMRSVDHFGIDVIMFSE
jgi:hypothetical protein